MKFEITNTLILSDQVEFRLFAQMWTSAELVRSRATHVLLAWTFPDHTTALVDPVTSAMERLFVQVKFALNFLFKIRSLEWIKRLNMENKIYGNNFHNPTMAISPRFRSRREKKKVKRILACSTLVYVVGLKDVRTVWFLQIFLTYFCSKAAQKSFFCIYFELNIWRKPTYCQFFPPAPSHLFWCQKCFLPLLYEKPGKRLTFHTSFDRKASNI